MKDKLTLQKNKLAKMLSGQLDEGCTNSSNRRRKKSLMAVMCNRIIQLRRLGKERTSETYAAALKSFMTFRGYRDVSIERLTTVMMQEYEAWLKAKGISMNTTSFYMRILRAAYNRAVDEGLAKQQFPFRHVYTGICKTVKRAVSVEDIKRIKRLDLSGRPALDFARDMFMFSFYTRGMSFIDMAYLKKTDLQGGVLCYRRRKTGQLLYIRWERCMQCIIEKYADTGTGYLLPIIRAGGGNDRLQYQNAMRLVNNKLKQVAVLAGMSGGLTMYVTRHSWASIARSKHIPLSVISEGMGHDNEATTQIYLASIDTATVDRANRLILRNL